MRLGERLERALGLGVRDEPRPIAVETRRKRPVWKLVSTAGAPLMIQRDGWDGEVQRALVTVLQNQVPVELRTGEPGIFWSGERITAAELRTRLGWRW